ncbi:MAG: hypothetical protein HYX97_01120 [Chloroflexi bacterium]|nr:hypothetical protein [Chloroflexota bacterium]
MVTTNECCPTCWEPVYYLDGIGVIHFTESGVCSNRVTTLSSRQRTLGF